MTRVTDARSFLLPLILNVGQVKKKKKKTISHIISTVEHSISYNFIEGISLIKTIL